MGRGLQKGWIGAGILALLVGGWVGCGGSRHLTTPAFAPSGPAVSSFMVLDRKSASRLLVSQTAPEYPTVAKINFIQGQVRLKIVVTPEGNVGEAHVIRGHPFLAASALKAISRWVYRPFLKGAAPTAFQTFVDVNFSLHPRKIEDLPLQADKDLSRRIRPPEVLERPSAQASAKSVRLRVLVNDKGRVIDWIPTGGPPAQSEAVRKDIERWTFRPAHWGTLPVPWYLDVDVPVQDSTLQDGDAGGK